MIWGWDGAVTSGASGCGVFRDADGGGAEGQARASAEAWLREHPAATVRLGAVQFAHSTGDLSVCWDLLSLAERARWHGGEIVWERVPPETRAVAS